MAEPSTLLEALLAFQKDAMNLDLGKDAPGQVGSRKYKYLTLEKLHDAVMPKLTEHGLVWMTRPMVSENGLVLRYDLFWKGQNDDQHPKGFMPLLGANDMQTLGSAITYARRYALLSVLGLVADEDDDGAAASQPKAVSAAPPRKPLILTPQETDRVLRKLEEAGVDKETAFKQADVDPSKGITREQALKMLQLAK